MSQAALSEVRRALTGALAIIDAYMTSEPGAAAEAPIADPGRLSANFTLAELTASATAARQGLDNTPPAEVLETLRATARRMEEVRRLLGDRPIIVTSGYRSLAVNKAVGGSTASAHMTGHAVDFTCPAFGTPSAVARHLAKHLPAGSFDQIIEEFGRWVHIGFGPGTRGQLLTARKASGRTVYSSGIKE